MKRVAVPEGCDEFCADTGARGVEGLEPEDSPWPAVAWVRMCRDLGMLGDCTVFTSALAPGLPAEEGPKWMEMLASAAGTCREKSANNGDVTKSDRAYMTDMTDPQQTSSTQKGFAQPTPEQMLSPCFPWSLAALVRASEGWTEYRLSVTYREERGECILGALAVVSAC